MIIFGDKLFKNPVKIIQAFNEQELLDAFSQIEELRNKFFLTGYIRYETFHSEKSSLPLLYFEVFENFEKFIPQKVQAKALNPHPVVNFEEYSNAINQIKKEIADGNTYEVNYTYDFEINYNGDDFELFQYLLEKQKTPYNFYCKNKYDTVLSFSPELFFTLKNNHIVTKPMKGTIKRGQNKEEDKKLKEFLQNDEKNRAENVMIVDLLRNDLGRIAKTGSVKVSKLFEIETHKTLHQMTSQIEADLRDDTTLYDIFHAIFPCGSITGAPKVSTMRIIDKVEKGTRDIYCGAIGLITPDETVFSVPIRILQRRGAQLLYRVGGAIVWDSDTQDEWEETLTKTKFLNENFQIIETIKVENGKLFYEKEHFERMKKSAEYFGFKNLKQLNPLSNSLPGRENVNSFPLQGRGIKGEGYILRLHLFKNGTITTEYKALIPHKTNKITISPIKINSQNEFMYHKTTYRPWFFDSYQKIAKGEIYDEIFFNEKEELTEGARSNIVLQINGKLYTPPLSCGLLNGIYRQQLNNVTEKILYKSDLENAEKIFCINSVRGMVEVHL